jgi:membrane-associated phospholipid phosphatase
MIDRTARLVSYALNPFLVTFVVVVLLAAEASSGDPAAAARWAAISLVLSVLPVFAAVIYLVRRHKLDGLFVAPRRQRTRIYVLASVLGAIGCLVLRSTGAPKLLLTSFLAGLIAVITFMVINLFWKISVHTAFVTASATIITIVYGTAGGLTLLLVPLIAWARLRLALHSPAQVAVGALLSGGIVTAVFWLRNMLMG